MFLLKKKKIYILSYTVLFLASTQVPWRDQAADTVSSAGCLPSVASLTEVRFQRDQWVLNPGCTLG